MKKALKVILITFISMITAAVTFEWISDIISCDDYVDSDDDWDYN